MSHTQKVFWSYLIGSQPLQSESELSAEDVVDSFGGSEDDVDVLLSAFRAKLELVQTGRESIYRLIGFVDAIAELRGGEICESEYPEDIAGELAHMRLMLQLPEHKVAA